MKIIGTPKRLFDLEIAEFGFPDEMEWVEAKKICQTLGEGWRLPTKDELNILFENKGVIGGFEDYYYWCSWDKKPGFQLFKTGQQIDWIQGITCLVRAVRSI